MCRSFYSAVSFILLAAMLCIGVVPAPAATVDVSAPPPCCAHDAAEPDTAPVCPTPECPHCSVLSAELADTLTCCTILNVRQYRFAPAGQYPPEIFPSPLEYPPKA